jgi:hypothetical protein
VYSAGDVLFASATTAGALTATQPTSPDFEMPIAYALNSKNNGTIFVRIQTGYELHEIYDVEVTSAADGDFLRYVTANSRWENVRVNLDDADDVTITSPVADHILKYNGSSWVNVLSELDALSDVTLTSEATDHLLRYNGSSWVNGLGELNILSDVSISGESTNQFLRYNGSNWVNATYSPNLNDLGDVNTTGSSSGDVLQYNGSSWVDAQLSLSDLSDGGNVLTLVSVPASTTSSGTVGQMAISSTHLYVCINTNTWRRIAHSTWT